MVEGFEGIQGIFFGGDAGNGNQLQAAGLFFAWLPLVVGFAGQVGGYMYLRVVANVFKDVLFFFIIGSVQCNALV